MTAVCKESGVSKLVEQIKQKVAIATAVVMVRLAKKEGVSAVQYTKDLQEKFILENHGTIDHSLEQTLLSHRQDEVLSNLRRVLPEPVVEPKLTQDSQDSFITGGGSLDWIDECIGTSKTNHEQENQTPQTLSSKFVNLRDKSAFKNIQFVESVMRIKCEIKRKGTVPTSFLQTLLYDDHESSSQCKLWSESINANTRRFSEDSGIGHSEGFSECSSVNFISGGVLNYALNPSKTDDLVLHSLQLVDDYIRNEIETNAIEMFYNWKGSLEEYACKTLCQYSHQNVQSRDMLMTLVTDVLLDIWSDSSLNQHYLWEAKMAIVNELCSEPDLCYDILQLISEMLDTTRRSIINDDNDSWSMCEKLYLFLKLFNSICRTLQSKCKDDVKNKVEEEIDVSKLWKEKWCTENDSDSEEYKTNVVDETLIPSLEQLIINVSNSYPLIARQATVSLKAIKELQDNLSKREKDS